MIYSMTSFGRSEIKQDWGMAVWELRAINHRYLELSIRLPDIFRELEEHIRKIVQQNIQRGKVEVSLRFYPGEFGGNLTINETLLKQLSTIATQTSATLPSEIAQLNVTDLLSWDGVITRESINLADIREPLLGALGNAVNDLKEGRAREGAALAKVIQERMTNIAEQVEIVKKFLPDSINKQKEKILARLEEAKVTLDSARLEQEMVYYVQRVDISEELDRTLSHLSEVNRTLKKGGAAGRRLDFMMQELNREANTLGSKSVDPNITHAAVEMKVLIEQIREQVQNIE